MSVFIINFIKGIIVIVLSVISVIKFLLIVTTLNPLNLSDILQIIIPLIFIWILLDRTKVAWYSGVFLFLIGCLNILYKGNIRSDIPVMTITEPLFDFFFGRSTSSFLSRFLLTAPLYIYIFGLIIICLPSIRKSYLKSSTH